MAVLKNKTQGNYTIVSQNIMRDKNLSLTERGMLLTLLSLPDNWHLTIMGLCQILPDGKDKISRTLNSLIGKGYVTRIQSRSNGGRFDSTDLEVHESPISPVEQFSRPSIVPKDNLQTDACSPYPENPDTVNPNTEDRCAENPPQYNTYISNNHTDTTKQVCSRDTLTDGEYNDLVAEFGKTDVDYQINRIIDHNYKGCMNHKTIKAWCKERKDKAPSSQHNLPKKDTFLNFPQRDYDFAELEKLLVCN